jgi:hypothetical protein
MIGKNLADAKFSTYPRLFFCILTCSAQHSAGMVYAVVSSQNMEE